MDEAREEQIVAAAAARGLIAAEQVEARRRRQSDSDADPPPSLLTLLLTEGLLTREQVVELATARDSAEAEAPDESVPDDQRPTVKDSPLDAARERQLLLAALEQGLITADQMAACRRLQGEAGSGRPLSLLLLLIRQGHLTREQVVELATGGEPAAPAPEAEGAADESAPLDETPAAEEAPELPDVATCDLVARLGAGPVASTCLVEAPDGRQYVLKVVHRPLARRSDFLEALREQAQAAARLDHPNLARTLGTGELRGDTFVLGEYVEGASLQKLLDAKGRLEVDETLAVAVACATALVAAEAAGLRHGAVVPTNILVAQNGTVKLADLGTARPADAELSIVETAEGVRSPYYLSPEHVARSRLDARSDLFSLGASLYHALTGRLPFTGDTTAEATHAISTGNFRRIVDVAPDVPRAFAAVVEKLLEPNPTQRYQSAGALLADLEAFRAGKVPQVQRDALARVQAKQAAKTREAAEQAAVYAAAEPPPRRRWPLFAGLGALFVVLAAGGIWLATRREPKPPEDVEEEARAFADPVKFARRGQEDLERVTAAYKPKTGEELAAAKKTIEGLKEIQKKYRGTDAAKEAARRLVPVQAEAMFQRALGFARAHADDEAEIAKRYRQVTEAYGNTEAAFKAHQELEKIEGAERKKLLRQIEEARQRAARLVATQRFGAALAEFNGVLKSSDREEVKQRVLREKLDITTRADEAYQKLDEQARDKIRGQYYAEAKALYARVVDTFGLEPYVGRAKGEIAVLEPLLAGATRRRLKAIDKGKYEFFRVRVEPSLALARTWQLDKAKAGAEALRESLRTAGVEEYLDDYLGDLALLASLKVRVVRRLNDRATPVVAKQFSMGKVGGRFDPKWLEATVLRADDRAVALRYGEVEVHRAWGQFAPDELYRLGGLVTAATDAQGRFVLGIHCLHAGLERIAQRELNAAAAAGLDVALYKKRLELARSAATPDSAEPKAKDEEASLLFLEAKNHMVQHAWDRALYRLALLRSRHASKDYDVSANLQEINQRIAECLGHVDQLEMETDLALGRQVQLLRRDRLADWQQRFGTWALHKGVLTGEAAEHDAECLLSVRHPPSYELRLSVRVLSGSGAILRLAGKGRPNLGFWIHATKPARVGLLHAQAGDDQPAQRQLRPYRFAPNTWHTLRAVVAPTFVEVGIGSAYTVRMPNKLPPSSDGLETYGLLVNAKSRVEFRDFTVRVLQEQ